MFLFSMKICGAAILSVGIALAVDESAWDWFIHISGDMSDDLFASAVYMMIGKCLHQLNCCLTELDITFETGAR